MQVSFCTAAITIVISCISGILVDKIKAGFLIDLFMVLNIIFLSIAIIAAAFMLIYFWKWMRFYM